MLEQIGDVSNIPKFIQRARDPNDSFRLAGFGHRVYKNYDPRARIVREMAHKLIDKSTKGGKLFEVAMKLEEIALQDEYFMQRKLYPNVDFYTGLIYREIGIPTSMFTVLFAVARSIGWIVQWKEMINDPERVIGRPRQMYIGPRGRDYLSGQERGFSGHGCQNMCPSRIRQSARSQFAIPSSSNQGHSHKYCCHSEPHKDGKNT
jgi:citrate synthase